MSPFSRNTCIEIKCLISCTCNHVTNPWPHRSLSQRLFHPTSTPCNGSTLNWTLGLLKYTIGPKSPPAPSKPMQLPATLRRGSLVLFILLLTLILMPQIYACVPTCGKEFKKSFSLVQHKQSCMAALDIRKKSQEIRKDKGGDDTFLEETSLSGRKERLKVGTVLLYFVIC